jgi:hypothetical protein
MLRFIMVFATICSTAVAGQPCNVGSVFFNAQIPGYVLYQAPQVQYSPTPVGQSYAQKDHAKVEAELAELKAMVRALAEKGLKDGSVSSAAFAVVSQPTINKYCVACHNAADPASGKGFPLTDIASLDATQHRKIFSRIVSRDPTKQMPPPEAVKRLGWDATAAGNALAELAEIEPARTVDVK